MSKHTFVVLAYKESQYLESCIQSVFNQNYKSRVVIATSTENSFIQNIANKYGIEVIVNPNAGKGIGADFDFALSCGNSELTTIAHQDDIYDSNYAYEMIKAYQKNTDSVILFSDYYELRNSYKCETNKNLKIKRILLMLLKIKAFSNNYLVKRSCLAFGNAICCPSVTFVKKNIPWENVFQCDMQCDIDWYAWEKLSRLEGKFNFINKRLMGHRVHEESTTTEIISDNIRTQEDLIMFKKFWPHFIAKALNKFYVKSEESNKVKVNK